MKITIKNLLLTLLLSSTIVLGACSKNIFSVYKRDSRQGNYITKDMVNKLKVNQTKQQVKKIMGSPTHVSNFHQNRWDYYYKYESFNENTVSDEKELSLFFNKSGKLTHYKGDWNIKGLKKK